MKNTHLNGLRLVALLVLCFTVLSACATSPASQADLFAHKDTNPLDRATIDAVGDKVAEWQIANLNNLSDYMRNYRNNIADRRGWHHGALYVGMMDWAGLPGNEQYYAPFKKISEEEEWRLGERLFHGDDHIVGQMYLTFYEREKDPKMIDHTIRQLNQVLVANPSDSLEFLGDGIRGVGRACQLRWCWCDALFMSPQTWMRLSLATGEDQYMAYADKEFWATTDYLKDPETSLYFRDSRYFERRDEEGNKIFWARGNGWVYAGLVNILRILPKDHPSYPKYVQLYRDMSKTIAGLQHENGLWSPSLLASKSKPETSGSGFMTYGLAWGVNSGHLDKATYGPVVKKGWTALVAAVADDGKLGWVQPVGAGPDSVFETDSQLYGVGAFLLAARQMVQAK
ncbi:MAG: glucuronyl hydrolase [Gammaproteobacteria bacterium]|nr:glucuronyl hydrolase [Gammaproteobacteria bacterium]